MNKIIHSGDVAKQEDIIPYSERCGFHHMWQTVSVEYTDGFVIRRCLICKKRGYFFPKKAVQP